MPLLKKIILSLLLGANVLLVVLLWVCCLSTRVSPQDIPHLSLLSLAFPFFLFGNMAFLVVWPLVRARLTAVPLAGLLAVAGYALDYCPISLSGPQQADGTLRVTTYNVGHLPGEKSFRQLIEYMEGADADIWCLQEASPGLLRRKDYLAMAARKGYEARRWQNRIIISRLPFVGPTDTIAMTSRNGSNGVMVCRVAVGADTLTVLNCHLESYALTHAEKTDYKDAIRHPNASTTSHTGLKLLRKMALGSRCRGGQVDSLCAYVERHRDEPMVVCGDFNATPISYAYQQLASRLSSAWREAGSGIGITYNQVGFFVRIDHLFHSPQWQCAGAHIDRRVISDHYPLRTLLRKVEEKTE